MLLTRIQAWDFLSFDQLDLQVGSALTVVTGPNGVGKTNLGRCVDVVRAALANFSGNAERERLESYQAAGRYEAGSFRVALGLTLDQPWERDLVLAFVRAAFACGDVASDGTSKPTSADLDVIAGSFMVEDSVAPLWSGTLHVRHDVAQRNPWFAAWEFEHDGQTWHVGLGGSVWGELRAGVADPAMRPSGSVLTLTQRLIASASDSASSSDTGPDDAPALKQMDFRAALPKPGQAIAFRISPPNDMSNPLPASLRQLATTLDVEDLDRRNFEFAHVIWEVLRRGVVLTDNRRVPFNRHFTPADLNRPLDLRDGANIPAELYRLKNGNAGQRRRYADIEAMFGRLTGRTLGLRARLEPPHVSIEGLLTIEPTVATDRGEHLIEFCGAGVQEALVLSTLLPGEPGRLFVLDEPAVNLEPVMQRRLISTLRDAGQCVVITHSPDLVPVNQPGDLANIVRLAPTSEGPRVWRAGALDRRAWSRWVKLLEPSHVRALLFAAKVILCEGSTEVGALQQWWTDTAALGLPNPEAAHIPIIDVGGHKSYGAYVEYLDAFGVPWAIVADGPALRSVSDLAKQLRNLGYLNVAEPEPTVDLEQLFPYWRSAGVFTVAKVFGDDGSKAGEFEALLRRVDSQLLTRIQDELGARKKPQVGALFAAEHPSAPVEVLVLYRSIMEWFGYDADVR